MKTISKAIIIILFLAVLLTSCTSLASTPTPNPMMDTAVAELWTANAETQAAIPTGTPTFPPSTNIPGPYAIIPPNPDQQVYIDPEGWYSVNFPADWKSTGSPNSFSGELGFFETGYLPELGFVSNYLDVCLWFANIEFKPEQSMVALEYNYANQSWSCWVKTKTDRGDDMAIGIFENPGADYAHRFIYTKHGNNYSSPVYLYPISWLKPFMETHPNFEAVPLNSKEKAFWDGTVALPPEIVVKEYLLPPEAQKGDVWRNFQLYKFVPPETIPTKAEKGAGTSHEKPTVEEQLRPLGYELKTVETNQGKYRQLFRDGRILFDYVFRVSDIYQFSTDAKSITAFIVETRPTLGTGYMNRFLVQNDVIYEWSYNNNDPSFAPVLYEGELLWARAAENAHVQIQKSNQQVVFDFATYYGTHLEVDNFMGWDSHWILEGGDFVIQDGEILNKEFGFQEVFAWRLVTDKPFYFFRKGQRVGISYNEQFLSLYYHDVIHGMCCGYAVNNPRVIDNSVSFFGQRDGVWYYVVVEFK